MHLFEVHRHTRMPGAELGQGSWLGPSSRKPAWTAACRGRSAAALPDLALRQRAGRHARAVMLLAGLVPHPRARALLAGSQAPEPKAQPHGPATTGSLSLSPQSAQVPPPPWTPYLNTDLTCSMSSGPMPSPGIMVTVCRPPYLADGG